jgi:SAM-dependent methyltransferase
MREADIRPADIHTRYLQLSAEDGARLFADSATRVERVCPGCGQDNAAEAYVKFGFRLVRCRNCKTLYVNPCPTPQALEPLYTDSPSARYWAQKFFPAVAEARRVRIFRPRVERVLAKMTEHKHHLHDVVDVGAGAAIFLEELRAVRPDLSLRAIEPGNALAAQCRQKGFETFEGFAESAGNVRDWAASADLVVSFEVLEHTPESYEFLAALRKIAKPGGLILLSGLCSDGFDIQVLGTRSNAVAPPHHLTFLSRQGVEALMHRLGLEPLSVFTPGELDVDIAANALRADDRAVADSFLRALLLGPDEAARSAFQTLLRDHGLSSHLWAIARKPL